MDETAPSSNPTDRTTPPSPPSKPRKPYTPPAVVAETRLETRAGSPLSVPIDPMNVRNDYGL